MSYCDLLHPNRPVSPGAVAVFDSGVGGLSVLRHMVATMGQEHFVYVADNGCAPYGDRPSIEIAQRCMALVDRLNQLEAKAVVVACNTATVWAIKRIRDRFSLPVFGVEPAIKPALMSSRSRVVGVVATTRTLESRAFHQLCRRYNRDAEIIPVACPQWVDIVETEQMGTSDSLASVARVLEPLLARGIDTLVLGCTHFPMLIPEIRRCVGADVELIEPGAAVARHLTNTLCSSDVNHSDQRIAPSVDFRLTAPDDRYFNTVLKIWAQCLATDLEGDARLFAPSHEH